MKISKVMTNFLDGFEPADLIAIIIIIGGFILKYRGGDGVTTALMTSVAFYYFGQKLGNKSAVTASQKVDKISVPPENLPCP